MNLDQLRVAVQSGGVVGATLRGNGDSFFIEIATVSGQKAMLTRVRGPEPRSFVNAKSGLGMLHAAGLESATVDLTNWVPLRKKMSRRMGGLMKAFKENHATR